MRETSKKFRRIALETLVALTRVALVAVILSSLIYSYFSARESQKQDFLLKEIEYSGVHRLDQEALTALIRKTAPANLLAVDLERVRNLAEGEPWIRHAIVRRKLPDRLIIQVVEREPEAVAAIDGELYIVDVEGIVLEEFGPDYDYLDRPILRGLHNIARENAVRENRIRMQTYLSVLQDLDSQLPPYSASVSEVVVENPERVAVVPLEEPVPVYLGNQNFRKRFQVFVSQKELYYQIKEKYGRIEYVDVTYDNRIIFHTPGKMVSESSSPS